MPAGKAVGTFIKDVGKTGAYSAAGTALGTLGGAFSRLGRVALDTAANILGIPRSARSAEGVAQELGNVITGVSGEVKTFTTVLEDSGAFEAMGSAATSLGNGLKAVGKAALDTVADMFGLSQYTDPAVGAAKELSEVVKTASGYLQEFGGWVQRNAGWIGHLTVIIGGLKLAMAGLNVVSTISRNVSGAFKVLTLHIGQFASGVENLPATISSVVQGIRDIPDTLRTSFTAIPGNIRNYFTSIGSAFHTTSTQVQAAQNSIAAADEAANTLFTDAGKNAGSIVPATSKAAHGIKSLGSSAISSAETVGSLADAAESFGGSTAAAGGSALKAASMVGKAIPILGTVITAVSAVTAAVGTVNALNSQAAQSAVDFSTKYAAAMGRAGAASKTFASQTASTWDQVLSFGTVKNMGDVAKSLASDLTGLGGKATSAKQIMGDFQKSVQTGKLTGSLAGLKETDSWFDKLDATTRHGDDIVKRYKLARQKWVAAVNDMTGLSKAGNTKLVQGLSSSASSAVAMLGQLNTVLGANGDLQKHNGQLTNESATYIDKWAGKVRLASLELVANKGDVQDARNAIYQARQSIIESLTSMGMGQKAAEQYADKLGLIPSKVTTNVVANTTMSTADLTSYIGTLTKTPSEKKTVMKALTAVAGKDIGSLQLKMKDVPSLVKTILTSDSLTARKDIETYVAKVRGIPSYWRTQVGVTGDASKTLDEINAKVSSTDGKSFTIQCHDQNVITAIQTLNGMKIDPKQTTITLDPSQFDATMNAAQAWQIDPKTGRIIGNTDDLWRKYIQAQGWHVDPKTGFIYGNNNQFLGTLNQAKGWSAPDKEGIIDGNNNPFRNKLNAVGAMPKPYVGVGINGDPGPFNSVMSALEHGQYDAYVRVHGSRIDDAIGSSLIKKATGGVVSRFASGGWSGRVLGAGTATSDSIPAMLSNGEYVLRTAAVRRLGVTTLNRMNESGRMPITTVINDRAGRPSVVQKVNVYTDHDDLYSVAPILYRSTRSEVI